MDAPVSPAARLTTPSPYLRDGLLDLAADLRHRADAAAKWCIETDAEVDRARKRLADAERLAMRAGADYAGLIRDAKWAEERAAELTAQITPNPREQLAATGLIPRGPFMWGCQPGDRIDLYWIDGKRTTGRVAGIDGQVLRLEGGEEAHPHLIERVDVLPKEGEPGPVSATLYQENGLPMGWDPTVPPGGYVCAVPAPPGGPGVDLPGGRRVCGQPVESEPCSEHGPDSVPPLIEDPDALTAKTPLRTLTDPPAAPAAGEPRHAKPKEQRGSRTGGFKLPRLGHREPGAAPAEQATEQTGDQQ
jgi:hypothetical protein